METVTVSATYHIAVPKTVVDRLSLRPGRKLSVRVQDGAILLTPLPDLDDIAGLVPGLSLHGLREKTDRL